MNFQNVPKTWQAKNPTCHGHQPSFPSNSHEQIDDLRPAWNRSKWHLIGTGFPDGKLHVNDWGWLSLEIYRWFELPKKGGFCCVFFLFNDCYLGFLKMCKQNLSAETRNVLCRLLTCSDSSDVSKKWFHQWFGCVIKLVTNFDILVKWWLGDTGFWTSPLLRQAHFYQWKHAKQYFSSFPRFFPQGLCKRGHGSTRNAIPISTLEPHGAAWNVSKLLGSSTNFR